MAEHDLVSEVYHIIDGSATLVLGSDIVDLKPRPADDRAVRLGAQRRKTGLDADEDAGGGRSSAGERAPMNC